MSLIIQLAVDKSVVKITYRILLGFYFSFSLTQL
jgi:hypothetical protein